MVLSTVYTNTDLEIGLHKSLENGSFENDSW